MRHGQVVSWLSPVARGFVSHASLCSARLASARLQPSDMPCTRRCRALLRRSRLLRARARALLLQAVDLRRPRRSDSERRRLLHPRPRRRERHRHARAPRAASTRSSTSAAIAARACTEQPDGHFAERIQCPYHAWTYDLDGRLLAAPHMAAGFLQGRLPAASRRLRGVGRAHLREPGEGRSRGRCASSSADLPRAVRGVAHGRPAARPADRLRREGQLEADRPELQRVPALPERCIRR